MFDTRKQLKAQLESTEAQVADLNAQIKELNEEVETLESQISGNTSESADIETLKQDFADQKQAWESEKQSLQEQVKPESIAKLILSAQTSDHEADKPIRDALNSFATAEIAKLGRAPLELDQENNNNEPELTGLAKAKAAIAKQIK